LAFVAEHSTFNAMSKAQHALEFEKIISQGRERKRNEELAARIFSKDGQRRASAPLKPGSGGSLASRVGVKKVCIHVFFPHAELQIPKKSLFSFFQ
jgi:hypothetical protein